MAFVYILYSVSIDTYYIGSCENLESRLEAHRKKQYANSFTVRAEDWNVFFQIRNLSYSQARKIENHIKKMKSRIYLENLSKYPEISIKLIDKYI